MIQILFSALYTKLIETTKYETGTKNSLPGTSDDPSSASGLTKATICNILAEAICSIDEDNKHTDAISALINQARESQRCAGSVTDDIDDAVGLSFVSTVKVFFLNIYVILDNNCSRP